MIDAYLVDFKISEHLVITNQLDYSFLSKRHYGPLEDNTVVKTEKYIGIPSLSDQNRFYFKHPEEIEKDPVKKPMSQVLFERIVKLDEDYRKMSVMNFEDQLEIKELKNRIECLETNTLWGLIKMWLKQRFN